MVKEEVEVLKKGTKWMAVMHLVSSKSFSVATLNKTMQYA
jgi:hypothetical protein